MTSDEKNALRRAESRANTEHKRAEKFKERLQKLSHELTAARRAIPEQFARGSAETMASVYACLPSDEVAMWLSQRMMASRKRKPPFGLSAEVEEAVRRETAAVLSKCGLDQDGPDDIVRMFQL